MCTTPGDDRRSSLGYSDLYLHLSLGEAMSWLRLSIGRNFVDSFGFYPKMADYSFGFYPKFAVYSFGFFFQKVVSPSETARYQTIVILDKSWVIKAYGCISQ